MRGRMLVTYASLKGSTTGVARTIADELSASGSAVDVMPVGLITRLQAYSAVIVGSAIYNARPLDDVLDFVDSFDASLSRMPVAYFFVGLTMQQDSAEHRDTVKRCLQPLAQAAPHVKPLSIGTFAGAFDSRQWPLVILLSLKSRGELPDDGDFRDWNAIRRWTRSAALALQAGNHAHSG